MTIDTPERAEQAYARISALPELQRFYNELLQRETFTLVLGAGCSRHCGIPDFKLLRKQLVSAFQGGPSDLANWDSEKVDDSSFERLWHAAGPRLRHTTLSNWFLERPPHLGAYYPLASLIQSGTFNTVVTYNIDGYLELALHSVGYDNFLVLINGCHAGEYIETILTDDKGTKILKTHGDHRHRVYALSTGEILQFGERWKPVLHDLFREKLLIVGYAAEDADFLRSMPLSANGDEVWYVNPAGPPPFLSAVMERRGSSSNCIVIRFDEFFTTLYYALRQTRIDIASRTRTRPPETELQYVSADLKVLNSGGLHTRPTALFIETASRYTADLSVTYAGTTANGKSIMGLMMLAAPMGAIITVTAHGRDASEMVAALQELMSRKFYLEE